MASIKRLFFDLEVSPNIVLSWRTGHKITLDASNIIQERAIICCCYKWENDKKISSIVWDHGCDKNLIKEFRFVLDQADEAIGHNIDKFDMRWFVGRNLIHGLTPTPNYKTVDTLKIARKKFYLNSNRLDYLGKLLLGEGKIDVPHSLWKEILIDNNESSLNRMVRYCKKDVDLLQKVWQKLSGYDVPKSHSGVMGGYDRWTCAHCGAKEVALSKTRTTPKGIIQRQMQCNQCHRYYTIADSVYTKYLLVKHMEKINA
jgi:hypothetical protein